MTLTRAQSEDNEAQYEQMQACIHALEQQLQALLSIQGQINPTPFQQRSAPPPVKLDLHRVKTHRRHGSSYAKRGSSQP
jgi:hypothetical protein